MSHRAPEQHTPFRWKSTLRELITAAVAFLPLAVLIGRELEVDKNPEQAGWFAVVAAVATALSSPAGRVWAARYLSGGRDTTPADPPESDSRP